jgi:serine phosphatase RsbU (regulator of sigma subunit)
MKHLTLFLQHFYIPIVIFFVVIQPVYANKDSLVNLIMSGKQKDTTLILTMKELAIYYLFEEGDVENAISSTKDAIKVAEKIKSDKWQGKLHSLSGYFYQFFTPDFEAAITHYFKALKHFDKSYNALDIFTVYLNLGVLYCNYNQLNDAEKYLLEALKMADITKNDYDRATVLFNLGAAYELMERYTEGIARLEEANHLYIGLGSEIDRVTVEHNLTNISITRKDIPATEETRKIAIQKYNEQKEVFKLYGEDAYYLAAIISLGIQHTLLNQLDIGLKHLLEAEVLARQLQDYNALLKVVLEISNNFQLQRQFEKEAIYLRRAFDINDTLFNERKLGAIMETQIKFETEKKQAENEILLQQAVIKDLEIEKKDIALIQSRTIYYSLTIILLLILGFTGFLYTRFKIITRQKKTIEHQKNVVDEKQKEISDSINYAQRIQEAILPSREDLVKNLKNGFVLFKPKDVVSGDFYWLETYDSTRAGTAVSLKDSKTNTEKVGATEIKEDEEKIVYFAAADCTGHGVPGALVSVVCSNALSKALLEENITQTGPLLDRTREIVIERFGKSGGEVKDGMDVSIAALNFNTRMEAGDTVCSIMWSGANNGLWIVRNSNGVTELKEVKPDKQPIGIYGLQKPFTTHNLKAIKGDTLYLFTDGFQDQFGGEGLTDDKIGGKKFKAANLKKLLVSIQHMTMDEQRIHLDETLEKWRGPIEQIDDICIIGVRI